MKLINEKPAIICVIADKQGMGKSTLAKYLASVYRYQRVSLADPLKKSLVVILKNQLGEKVASKMVLEDKDDVIPGIGVTARDLLVAGGQGYCSSCPELFLKSAICLTRFYNDSGIRVVVDDVRKPYEYDAFKEAGAFFIRVVRPANTIDPAEIEGLISDKPAYRMLIDSEPGDHTMMYHLADTLMKGLDYDPD